MTDTAYDRVRAALEASGRPVRNGEARCPAHDDRNPSLSISQGREGVVVHCHVGCTQEDVVAALGLTMADLFDAPLEREDRKRILRVHDYTDPAGQLLFQTVRFDTTTKSERFRQRKPNGNGGWIWKLGDIYKPLYRLPDVLAAITNGHPIIVAEGEKDCDAIRLTTGIVATTNPLGAGNWKPEHTAVIAGANVTIIADNDTAGRKRARQLERDLRDAGCTVTDVLVPIDAKDAAEVIGMGKGLADGFQSLEDVAPADDQPDPGTSVGILADGFRPSDVGNADRLAAVADGHIRFVHAWTKWLVYRDGCWRLDHGEALVTDLAKRVAAQLFSSAISLERGERGAMLAWAEKAERAGSITAMIRLARGMAGVLADHRDLDRHPWLLNVTNGTVDLHTGQLGKHDPEHLLTVQAPTFYDPDADAPVWFECLERWQPDRHMRDYLQRLIGSGATGHPVEHLIVNIGTGSNGKSKFYGAIKHALGPYVVVPHKGLLVAQAHEQHETVKADLFGARLLLAPETEAGDRLVEAQIKELTGGDTISARRMREDRWDFEPTWTAFMHTNHKPRVRGTDEGVWRRLRVIPWETTIPKEERDPELSEKLAGEASGILNWIVNGAIAFAERGLTEPESVTAATDIYRRDEDHLARYLEECVLFGEGYETKSAQLRSHYEEWCEAEGEKPHNPQAVGTELQVRGGTRATKGKHRWLGVGLASEAQEPLTLGGEQ